MELHCNVFELSGHCTHFLFYHRCQIHFSIISFIFFPFSIFSFYKSLPSLQNNVKEPLYGRWVEVIFLSRVDGEREVSLPFSVEHCMSRLIRAQPFSPTSLHRAKKKKAKMGRRREIGQGGMLLEREDEVMRVKCRHRRIDTGYMERVRLTGTVASLWL